MFDTFERHLRLKALLALKLRPSRCYLDVGNINSKGKGVVQRVPTRKCKSVGAAGDLLGVLFVNYIFIASRSIAPQLKRSG